MLNLNSVPHFCTCISLYPCVPIDEIVVKFILSEIISLHVWGLWCLTCHFKSPMFLLYLPQLACMHWCETFEFSLNVFTEFSKFSDRKHYILKRLFKHATSCVRDQDAITAPARHGWERGFLNLTQFMLQWFIRFSELAEFTEFLIHLGNTPMCLYDIWWLLNWLYLYCLSQWE